MTTLINKLRTLLLSPDSQLELALRTIYHKVLSTRIYFLWQDFQAKRSYKTCRSLKFQSDPTLPDPAAKKPMISFVINWPGTDTSGLKSTLETIQKFNEDSWEVTVVSSTTNGLPDTDLIRAFNGKLTALEKFNPLNGLDGDYVLFCEAGDVFFDHLLTQFYNCLPLENNPDLTYYDCEFYRKETKSFFPFFKPSALSPALLLSVNYLSRCFFRREAIQKHWSKNEQPRSICSLELDIALRLCESGCKLTHIPTILITQTHLPTADSPELQETLEAHLVRQGLKDVTLSQEQAGLRFSWNTGSPSLSIIILSRNNIRFLKPLIPDLLALPFTGHFSIHIVDNGSDDPETLSFYDQILQNQGVSIIPYPKPFNYSEAINLGVRQTDSDLVLLMNDDMAVHNITFLNELSQWAIRPEIGVVSGKLLRKNHTIQHAGIVLGLTGFMGHIYLNAPEHYHGLHGSADWCRNYLAMTGACQMVRRSVFNEVGGYDEDFVLAFGDIDFCLKVHEIGYLNVYSPFAQLYHYEGSSRGYQTPPEDALKGYETMEPYLINDDPYFSPNLTYTRIPKCAHIKQSKEDRKQQFDARKDFYMKNQ
jgi:O-antigen biosynthesis protein